MKWTTILNNKVGILNLVAGYLLIINTLEQKERHICKSLCSLFKDSYLPSPHPRNQTEFRYDPKSVPPEVAGMLRRDRSISEGHFGDAGGRDNWCPMTNRGSRLYIVREGPPRYDIN